MLFRSMERESFEELSYEQLRDELIKSTFPVTTSRSDCIDRLIFFHERSSFHGSGDQSKTSTSNSNIII